MAYGNLCYELARIGQLKRIASFQGVTAPSTKAFDPLSAPSLTILVPSYKEEIPVIRQTLLSAALQNYPNKRVVLLLDDPPAPKTRSDRAALWAARNLPFELQALLNEPATHITGSRAAFLARRASHTTTVGDECVRLSDSFRLATQCGRVAFLTGGAFTPAARDFLERAGRPRLDKPFEAEALERLVAVELGRHARP